MDKLKLMNSMTLLVLRGQRQINLPRYRLVVMQDGINVYKDGVLIEQLQHDKKVEMPTEELETVLNMAIDATSKF